MRSEARDQRVHFLDCDEVVLAGVRFLGCTLWTDFRLRIDDHGFAGQPVRLLSDRYRSMAECSRNLADYAAIRVDDPHTSNSRGSRRLVPMDTLQLHRRHRSWLRAKLEEPFDGPTVVVTHHAPHRGSLAPRFTDDWASGGFVNELRPEFFRVPALWVHGHTHDSFDYKVEGCRVVCNPRGYLNWHGEFENKAFDPGLVVEVECPMNERNRPGSTASSLLALATEVFGVDAHAWLKTPHHLLSGATPSAFAAEGGTERVRSILLAIQYGGAV